MIVFTVVFGKLGKFPSEGAPYPILVFAAMLPWQFFANSLSEASNSLIGNANLISKVYFPRLIIPSSSVVPEKWRLLYSLNPMVGVIDGFRWAILGGDVRIFWPGFLVSNGLVLLSLVTGIWYFRQTEKTFADVI